jgi:hypothetical protein
MAIDVAAFMNLLNTKYDKTGGPVGPMTINGDLRVNGSVVPSGGGRGYGIAFTDYAEYFERGEHTEAGDIIMLNIYSDKEEYIRARKNGGPIVGVHNDDFAMIVGSKAEYADYENRAELNLIDLIPVALKGRVMVKVKGKVEIGDVIVASDEYGIGVVDNNVVDRFSMVGKAIERSDDEGIKKIKILIR